MQQLKLFRNRRKRLEQGHPWIYKSEIEEGLASVAEGEIVSIRNHQGVYLATAYVNPKSQITARVLTYDQNETIDFGFFIRRIATAKLLRSRYLNPDGSYRAVYGEADFLPGLVVDKYGDILVVQILSYGMEVWTRIIVDALIQIYRPTGILLRNDVSVRRLEGLPLEVKVIHGTVPDVVEIEENGLHFLVDVKEGQKTGYFFDQRENRARLAPFMKDPATGQGVQMLECFCHTGAFAIHAAHYGALHVRAVDISTPALHVAKQNAERNQMTQIEFLEANAFDFLREEERAKQLYDVVLLDPPAFAKSKGAIPGALRGYKDINLRGMKLVREGGILMTASCSHHVSPQAFQDTVLEAAVDAHKVLRLLQFVGAGIDHPQIAGVSEGNYLKFAIYQVFPRSS